MDRPATTTSAPGDAAPGTRGFPAGPWPLLALVAFVVAVHVVWVVFGDAVVRHGLMADGDGFARLLRVERLWQTGGWLDLSLPRANWPDGGALHWTRLFDVLVIALALPLMPVFGETQAIYWAGALTGPVLHVLAALAMAWAAAPLCGRRAALVAGGLTAVQFGIIGYSIAGRADHHALYVPLAILALGLLARALAEPGSGRLTFAAGAVVAAGVWVGPEAQMLGNVFLGVLGLRWVVAGAGASVPPRDLVLGLALGLAAVLVVERGPVGVLAVAYDRVSVVHFTQAALIAAFWITVAGLEKRGRAFRSAAARLVAGAVAAALVLAAMRTVFPDFLFNPISAMHPDIQRIVFKTAEFASIEDPRRFLVYTGGAFFAVPWAAWRARRAWGGAAGWTWATVAAAGAVYVALSVMWIRWTPYVGVFAAVAVADAMVRAHDAIDRRFGLPARVPVLLAAMLGLAVGPAAVGLTALRAELAADRAAHPAPDPAFADDPRQCPLKPLAAFLDAPPWNERPLNIVASVNFGPELLYRTRHRVLATMHHRNAPGILDGYRILRGNDDEAILTIVRRRGVDLIVTCRFGHHDTYFHKGWGPGALYLRLARDEVPAWLAPVALPAPLAARFRLFRMQPID